MKNTKAKFSKATQFSLIVGGFIATMIVLNIVTGVTINNDMWSEFTVKGLILDHIAAAVTASIFVFEPWKRLKSRKAAV